MYAELYKYVHKGKNHTRALRRLSGDYPAILNISRTGRVTLM